MKSRSFRRPVALRAATLVQAMSGLLVLTLHMTAKGQELPLTLDAPEAQAPAGPPPRIWVEPRISVSQGFSNNGNLAGPGQDRQSDLVTEIGPGVGVVVNNNRVKGFLDYSLRGVYDARNTVDDNFQQSLNANGTINAWDNRAFVDVSGIIGQQAISAFGSPSAASVGNTNLSETSSFRVSPYLRGVLPGSVDYELRYTLQTTRTDSTQRSDVTSQDVFARLGRQSEGQGLGWTVDAGRSKVDYTLGAQQTLDTVTGRLFYAFTPALTVSALGGVESNDLITTSMTSYRTYGVGVDWRPSERSRLLIERTRRFFGDGHNVELEYRGRRSIWRYTDTRDLYTSSLDNVSGQRGTLYSLIDALSPETDPVLRAQSVNAELQRLGLPADYPVTAGFLASRATVQRIQELSLGLFAPRTTFIFALGRSNQRAVNPLIMLADDFALAGNIVEKTWRFTVAHRLTPLTSVNVGLMNQSTQGVNSPFSFGMRTLTMGVTTRLAMRTSGSVQLRFASAKGSNPYKENAVLGVITHRF